MEFLNTFFKNDSEFIVSTISARINGFLGGNCTLDELKEEVKQYGFKVGDVKQLIGFLNSTSVPNCV